jgi:hypothetical protein
VPHLHSAFICLEYPVSFKGFVSTGSKLVDKASSLVPESVPRPVAKAGIAVFGALFVWGLIQKVSILPFYAINLLSTSKVGETLLSPDSHVQSMPYP